MIDVPLASADHANDHPGLRACADEIAAVEVAKQRRVRSDALELLGERYPGLTREQYGTELDAALARADRAAASWLGERTTAIAEAREMDVLNGVCRLYVLNGRNGHHLEWSGFDIVTIQDALGDLHSPARLKEATVRTKALVRQCMEVGHGPRRFEEGIAELIRADHPGFTMESVWSARDWGLLAGR